MVGGLDNSTGIQGKDNSNVPNLSGDAWRKPQPTVEQDATIGAPPTGSGGNTTWRAGYNQVAPIFPTGDQSQQPQQQPQQQTQWRPGYNGVAPIFNGNQQQQQAPVYNGGGNTEVYNPNANGNQNNGPVWHAPTNTPGWNAPGPAQNPAAKPGDASTGGQPTTARTAANNANNLYDPHRADIDPFLNHPIGFGGDLVIGGVAGVAFGGPIPYMLSHTAESIVNSAAKASGPEAAAASPLISESGLIGKIIPGDWRAGVNSVGAKLDQATAKLATSNEGDLAVSSAKWYQNHFDPRYFTNSGLETQLNNFKGLNNQVTSIIDSDAKELAALQAAPDLSALSQADRLRLEVLSDRQDWLNTDAWKTVSGGASQLEKLKALQLDAATSPKVQGPLFDPGEMKLLQDRQEARASYNEMYNKKADGAGFWGDSPGLNFIKGAGFVGVTMLADNYLDRLFAGKDHKQGLNDSNMFTGMPLIGSMSSSWHTNALLLPMAFASGSFTSPRGLITKAAWTAGALVGGHVLDAVLPASANKEVSSILSPNGVDAVLMAGSWLMPAANLKQRLLMIGGAWAVGRVVNLFRGPSNEDVKDDGYADMQKDTKQRTLGSMEDSINYFKELGSKDDYALRLYTSDWLKPGRQYDGAMSSYRGAVILCDAFGESRLANGTLVPGTTTEFVNAGQNLDLGGQALRSLIIASTNVDRAKQQTQNEMGQSDHGKTVTQGEIDDLTKMGAQINSVIQNKIYGKHDIPAAIDGISKLYSLDNTKGTVLLKQGVDNSLALNRGSTNTQFTAKLFRDLAVLDLGMAAYTAVHSDPSTAATFLYGSDQGRQETYNNGQAKGYDGAMDAIALAKQMDPNNPDNAQLDAYAAQLAQKLPAAIQKEVSNPIFNPLNVNDQVNHPGSTPATPAQARY